MVDNSERSDILKLLDQPMEDKMKNGTKIIVDIGNEMEDATIITVKDNYAIVRGDRCGDTYIVEKQYGRWVWISIDGLFARLTQ